PREDCRPSARHRLRRHHDAAARWLPDLLADQAQQGLQVDPGDHAVLEGRALRPRPGPHRRLRALSHQALHEGRTAGCNRVACREMIVMALILIVDDSPTEVHVFQKALERHGYKTATATDGVEAVRMAKEIR